MYRPRFQVHLHADQPMVAATSFTYNGVEYEKGDPFPAEGEDPLDAYALQTQHSSGYIDFANGDPDQPAREAREARREKLLAPAEGEVTTTPQPGGYYLIAAPWLDEPTRIRGKAKAEAEAKRLTKKGEPDEHHGVKLTAGEGGWYTITRSDLDGELKVQGEDKARAAAAQLRAGETIEDQPAEWTPPEPLKAGDLVTLPEDAGDLAGQTGTIDSIDGDEAIVLVDLDEDHQESATVPLASLTPAAPQSPPEPAGEPSGEPGAPETPPPAPAPDAQPGAPETPPEGAETKAEE